MVLIFGWLGSAGRSLTLVWRVKSVSVDGDFILSRRTFIGNCVSGLFGCSEDMVILHNSEYSFELRDSGY